MKKLPNIELYTNYAVAIGLLLCYLVPYLPPKHFGYLSVLGLFTPVFLLLNLLFALYWLIRRKRRILISVAVLCLGWNALGRWVQVFSRTDSAPHSVKLLSFNVRLFNHYHWYPDTDLYKKINDFFKQEAPDIIVLQEFYNSRNYYPQGYPYKAIVLKQKKDRIGLAVLSKQKIVASGSLQFAHTANNGMYADVLMDNDTVRLYNLHLESLHLSAKEEDLLSEDKEVLVENISHRFASQQQQVEVFLAHKAQCRHKTIVCGDFNNTAFSYIYRKVRGSDLTDAFVEAGKGFGRTFAFKRFPMRIDFILPSKHFQVTQFQTHYLSLSDHYPLTATLAPQN